MAIEGPIRELGLTDLLQLLHLSRKTGVLRVGSDHPARDAEVHFDRGAVVGASAAGDAARIGRLLLMAGRATDGQVDRALAEQARSPGRRLGAILVEREGVARADVEAQLRFQVEETVFDLVRWTEGSFRFEETPPEDPGPISIRVATDALLMESVRRVDEWSALASGPPDTELVPLLVEEWEEEAGALSLQPLEWEVLAAVDGERTLRETARLLGQGEFEVAKAVFSLVSAGVVELRHGSAAPAPAAAVAAPAPGPLAEVEADVRAGRLERAEARLAELVREDGESAPVQALLGRLEGGRGNWGGAVEHLRRAVHTDPLLAEAYRALAVAATHRGDFGAAAEAIATYLRFPATPAPRREWAGRLEAALDALRHLLEEEPE